MSAYAGSPGSSALGSPRRAAAEVAHERADQASALRALVRETRDRQRRRDEPRPPRQSAVVVAIASGKGGVGKTTIAVNLCVAFAARGLRTVLLDADLGMANADVMCGLMPARRLESAVPESGGQVRGIGSLALEAPGGFRIIPGAVGVARMAELSPIQRVSLIEELARLERSADVVVIDNGAGLSRTIRAFLNAADAPVVVATPEPTSIADAYALIKCITIRREREEREDCAPRRDGSEPKSASALSLVVSQCTGQREAETVHTRIATVCAKFLGCPVPLLGWVSQDGRVGRSVRKRTPLMLDDPRSHAARDITRIADRIAEEHVREGSDLAQLPRKHALARLVRWLGYRPTGHRDEINSHLAEERVFCSS